jgi:hypothetical protein
MELVSTDGRSKKELTEIDVIGMSAFTESFT